MTPKKIFLLFFLTMLTACSSTESDLKDFLKCGIASSQLEEFAASRKISSKMEQYIQKNKIDGSARFAMQLAQEVRDDLALDEKGLERQIYTLVKTYNSSTCMNMHEQKKIDMPIKYYVLYPFL